MEHFKDDILDFDHVMKLGVDDCFPNFFYPNQFSNQTLFKNKILEESEKLEKFMDQKVENKSCKFSRISSNEIEVSKQFELSESKSIIFMNKEMSVNEVKVGFDNLIFACGDNYAKIYYYDIQRDSVRELFELFDENQKFNCLDFSEFFEIENKVFKYDAKYL